ncbi:MAG: CcoQ/FixQ family Cbb3-type cytochrome c oxidase assembly chaperone [Cytophagales bacterium]|nr:CcoQ/FixQ family Cbb3-type cytochrome c oxidase assembly chaperone [Cytophagales bacterium]MDW8384724.1 CcoQ/FixQ family Cbb3-type cytochrome c oxidase assembly chaperone [Flammeovirgaceae bacterium]
MRQFLEGVTGVDIYLTTSLLIFFLFFLAVLVWFFTADKKHMEKLSRIPLKD